MLILCLKLLSKPDLHRFTYFGNDILSDDAPSLLVESTTAGGTGDDASSNGGKERDT